LQGLAPRTLTVPERESLQGLRIGYVKHFHQTDLPAHPEIQTALDAFAEHCSKLGADVHPVTLSPLQTFNSTLATVASVETWCIHRDNLRERPEAYSFRSRRRLAIGAFLSGADYLEAQRRRRQLANEVSATLQN